MNLNEARKAYTQAVKRKEKLLLDNNRPWGLRPERNSRAEDEFLERMGEAQADVIVADVRLRFLANSIFKVYIETPSNSAG